MTFTTHTNAPAVINDKCFEYDLKTPKGKRFDILKKLGFVDNNVMFVGCENKTSSVIKANSKLVSLPSNATNIDNFYFAVDSNYYHFNTSSNILKELMIHDKGCSKFISAKSNTHNTTLLKELISKELFEHPDSSEKDVLDMIAKNWGHLKPLYDSLYYVSAVSQLEVFKKIGVNCSEYHFELQMGKYSSIFYKMAKKLSNVHKDNWNPADIWVMKKTSITSFQKLISLSTNIHELNQIMRDLVSAKELLPISLKHISNGKAKLSLCNMGEKYKSKYSFNIEQFNISESFKSIFVLTDSDYQLKLNMRASADCLNLNQEGKIKGKNASEGAVPNNLCKMFISENKPTELANGYNTPKLTRAIFERKHKTFVKYDYMISNDIKDITFESLDEITGKRYQIIADHIEYIMENPHIVEFSYFASKKLYHGAGPFYLISE